MIIKIFSYSNILRTLNRIYKNSIHELKYINDFNKKTKEFKKCRLKSQMRRKQFINKQIIMEQVMSQHLQKIERIQIQTLLDTGNSIDDIAIHLNRHRSTI